MKLRTIGVALGSAAFAGSLAIAAAEQPALTDPTRPPNASGAPGAEGEAPAGLSGQLQSVLIAPGRRIAVINGQSVSVGSKFGDATVTRIVETEVTLKRGDDVEVLKLLPGTEKKEVHYRQSAAEAPRKSSPGAGKGVAQ